MPSKGTSWIQKIRIHYNNGRVLQGVVLAFGGRLVRVAIQDTEDARGVRLVNQVWVSEDCEVVKLDFAQSTAPVETEESDRLETLFLFELGLVPIQRVM